MSKLTYLKKPENYISPRLNLFEDKNRVIEV